MRAFVFLRHNKTMNPRRTVLFFVAAMLAGTVLAQDKPQMNLPRVKLQAGITRAPAICR